MTLEDFENKYGFSIEYLRNPKSVYKIQSTVHPVSTGVRLLIYNNSVLNRSLLAERDDLLLHFFETIPCLKGVLGYKMDSKYRVLSFEFKKFHLSVLDSTIHLYRLTGKYNKKPLDPNNYKELFELHKILLDIIEYEFHHKTPSDYLEFIEPTKPNNDSVNFEEMLNLYLNME